MAKANVNDNEQIDSRWRRALMSFFMRRVSNHAEAQDLTQEVFVRMLVHAENINKAPDSYVFQIAMNLLQDRARRASVRSQYFKGILEGDNPHDELDPHRIVSGQAAMETFIASLSALPERARNIFILYKMEGISHGDIADSLGVSKSLVKQEVAKAMAFMMKRMRDLP